MPSEPGATILPRAREAEELLDTLQPMLVHWQALLAAHPQACSDLAGLFDLTLDGVRVVNGPRQPR